MGFTDTVSEKVHRVVEKLFYDGRGRGGGGGEHALVLLSVANQEQYVTRRGQRIRLLPAWRIFFFKILNSIAYQTQCFTRPGHVQLVTQLEIRCSRGRRKGHCLQTELR